MHRYRQITIADRNLISMFLDQGMSITRIAKLVEFSKATISREVRRNKTRPGSYDPVIAQRFRDKRVRMGAGKRPTSIVPATQRWIRKKLIAKWSPEQISGRARIEGMQPVSHEYVYQLIQKDRQLGGDLYTHLRRSGRKRYRFKSPKNRSKIPNRVEISRRPKVVAQRSRLGDLEGDLIVGRHQLSHIVVVADRLSRKVGIEKLRVKTKREVNKGLKRILHRFGGGKTLTLDNGLEFGGHEQLSLDTGIKVYFAHAYAAWERGTVENTNGLLRQFLPKKTDFRKLTKEQLREIESHMNNRPRKCLRFRTPDERHFLRSL